MIEAYRRVGELRADLEYDIDGVVVKPPVWAETSAASRTGRREKRSRIKVGWGVSVGGR